MLGWDGDSQSCASFEPVMASGDDWRRTGQERYLSGLRFTWKRYQALSGNWEHEHCEFCSKKFLDASYSDWARQALESGPDEHTAACGFTNLRDDAAPAGKHWICEACFNDFVAEFRWEVVGSAPEGWPYEPPEPTPRPTAADYDPEGPKSHPYFRSPGGGTR
jgi:hypothetical protein